LFLLNVDGQKVHLFFGQHPSAQLSGHGNANMTTILKQNMTYLLSLYKQGDSKLIDVPLETKKVDDVDVNNQFHKNNDLLGKKKRKKVDVVNNQSHKSSESLEEKKRKKVEFDSYVNNLIAKEQLYLTTQKEIDCANNNCPNNGHARTMSKFCSDLCAKDHNRLNNNKNSIFRKCRGCKKNPPLPCKQYCSDECAKKIKLLQNREWTQKNKKLKRKSNKT